MGTLRLLLTLVLLLLLPASALASPLFETFGDPAGDGGYAGRYGAPSVASTYFNPALLPQVPTSAQLGIYGFSNQIGVSLDPRPPGGDTIVSLDATAAFQTDGASFKPVEPPPIPTSWLEFGCKADCERRLVEHGADARPKQGAGTGQGTRGYLWLGLITELIDEGRLTFGMTMLTPLTRFIKLSTFYPDEREQYFSNSLHPELYSDRLEHTALAVAWGSRLYDWLSIGMSLTLDINTVAGAPTYAPDPSALDQILVATEVSVATIATPHFGIVITPFEDLQIGATFHTVQSLEVDLTFSTFLADGSEQSTRLRTAYAYMPWQAALGASYRFRLGPEEDLKVIAGADYMRWSEYRNRHDENPTGTYAWSDVLVPTAGVRYRNGAWDGLLDFTYNHSPVPEQTGRTNYVDSNRFAMTGGAHWKFSLNRFDFRVGLTAQMQRLFERRHDKLEPSGQASDGDLVRDEVPDDAVTKLDLDKAVEPRVGLQTNNPGYPGYRHDGWIYGGGVSLDFYF